MSNLIFTNARLIDPESGKDSLGWLQVTDGRIAGHGDGEAPASDAQLRSDRHQKWR